MGINLKGFVFQLITFLIVLFILQRWVFPKLVATIEKRRQTLEQSLADAKLTEETLAKAEVKAEEILAEARSQADEALAEAKKSADVAIAEAESTAAKRAELIIKEAEEFLSRERAKLRGELKNELADLVADATEKVVRQKLNQERDRTLIRNAIKELA